MRVSVISIALVAGLAASPAFAVNLITNGDFTSLTNGLGQITDGAGVTSATGWSTAGYNAVLSVADQGVNTVYGANNLSLWDAANGGANSWNGLAPVGNILAMDGDFPGNTGDVRQTVSGLTVGKSYTLTFGYAFAQQAGFNGNTI